MTQYPPYGFQATVDWDEFCTYMMVGLQEKDDLDNERENPVMVCPVLFETLHRTAIVKVMYGTFVLGPPIRPRL